MRVEVTASLLDAVMGALEDQICVIDAQASIVFVNQSWINFGIENGCALTRVWVGESYQQACTGTELDPDTSSDGWLAWEGIAQVLDGRQSRFEFEYPCHGPDALRWFLMRAVPLRVDGEPQVLISHINITVRKLAEQAVERLSRLDALTNLSNRRHFMEFLRDECRRAIRTGSSISLMLIDLDHFKTYNDQRGHLLGDEALQAVAGILQSMSRRPTDLAARFGGDEFALVLGGASRARALEVAHDVVQAVERLALEANPGVRVTASVGVVCMAHCDSTNDVLLLSAADQALYDAKRAGRSRWMAVDLPYRADHPVLPTLNPPPAAPPGADHRTG